MTNFNLRCQNKALQTTYSAEYDLKHLCARSRTIQGHEMSFFDEQRDTDCATASHGPIMSNVNQCTTVHWLSKLIVGLVRLWAVDEFSI